MQSKRHFDPMKSIKLSSVKISGFATRNMLPGEEGFILVRAKLTSSQPEFHLYMRGIDSLVVNAARTARKELTLMIFNLAPAWLTPLNCIICRIGRMWRLA